MTEAAWTVNDVARYLRLHPQTVRRMAASGVLPAVKIGRGGRTSSWRFDPVTIRTFAGADPA